MITIIQAWLVHWNGWLSHLDYYSMVVELDPLNNPTLEVTVNKGLSKIGIFYSLLVNSHELN
jgi:hypothetical protein